MPLLTLPQATSAQSTFPVPWFGTADWAVDWSPTTLPGQTPIWVELTSSVMSISINRGRQRTLDRFEAGTATIVLKNADRKFDPSNTAGIYYGSLLPMRQFRIRMQYGNATYTRFVGFADSYEQNYDRSNRFATCVIQLTDAFKLLALTKPPSPWAAKINGYGSQVSAWFRMSESEAAAGLRDSSQYQRDGFYSGSPTMAQTGLVTNDANGCVQFVPSSYAYSNQLPAVNAQIAIECWFSSSSATAQTIVAYGDPNSGSLHCSIELDATGHLVYRFADSGNDATYSDTTTSTYNDGNAHHVSLYMSETVGGNVGFGPVQVGKSFTPTLQKSLIEVDGATPTVTRSSAALSSFSAVAGQLVIGSNFGLSQYMTGKIDEVVVYMDPTVSISLNGNYATGSSPYANQQTGTRISTVLDLIGWSATERTISTGNSTLQAASFSGSVLDHFQAVNQTEQGRLFVGNDGKIVFQARQSTLGAQPSVTFNDTTAGIQFSDVQFTYDDVSIRNSVIAQRTGGGQLTVQDPTSVANYFERTYSASALLHNNDNQTRDWAAFIVNRYKDPALRISSLRVQPERNPTQIYPAVGKIEIGTVLTVNRTPQSVGSTISATVTVEGITETVTPDRYEITYRIETANTSYYWILEDSTYGVLDTTTLLAY